MHCNDICDCNLIVYCPIENKDIIIKHSFITHLICEEICKEEYYQRFTILYNDWDKKIESIDFEKLTQQEKVDYLLLKNLITKESYFLNIDYKAFKEVAYVTDFTKNIYPFIIERRRGKKPDAQALATTLHTASKTVEKEIKDISEREKNKLEIFISSVIVHTPKITQDLQVMQPSNLHPL